MSSLLHDLRYALRLLRARPGFTSVAVATLALGIGANTAIFSVINAVLLGGVPFADPERLVFLGEHSQQVPNMSVSYPNFLDWEERNRSFEAIAAHNYTSFNLTGLERPEVLVAVRASAALFPILRAEPIRGRVYGDEEDRIGGAAVAVVSFDFWQNRLGSDPDVVGTTLSLDGDPYEIIGVMPRGFLYPIAPVQPDLWTPIERFAERWMETRGSHPGIYVTARLRDEVSMEAARDDMDSIAAALATEYPDTNTGNGVSFSPLTDFAVRNVRPALLVLMGAVGLVLLIACVNVTNLLLARGSSRGQEIAVRSALGSGRRRLLRQLLTESLLLALFAAALSVAVAWGVISYLRATIDPSLQSMYAPIALDGRVLGFTALVALATGVLFGLFPALQLLRTDLAGHLKDGAKGSAGGSGLLRGALVVAEVALALVLLVGALLFIQSFRRLVSADPGFDSRRVLTVQVSLPTARYSEPARQSSFFEQLLEQARALPGTESVATTMPLLGGWQTTILAEGQEPPAPGEEISVDITRVSPDYFATMGIPLLRGRSFEPRDRPDAVPVAIVDTTLAESFWPGQEALGKRIKLDSDPESEEPWIEVIGLVPHVKNYGVGQPSRIEIYLPTAQDPFAFATLLVKTEGEPRELLGPIEGAVRSLDPNQPISRVRTLDEILGRAVAPQRLAAGFLGVFSALALFLATIGIYGVMAYTVAQRRQEIGIRMALGANAGRVLRLVLVRGLGLAAAGVVAGLLLTLALSPLISSQLFGTSSRDPLTLIVLPALLLLVALLASVLPALRASRVHPVTVLRYE